MRSALPVPVLPSGRMLIDGRWVDARSGATLDVFDPSTGDRIGSIARGSAADVDAAVIAARAALDSSAWSRMSASDRERLMMRLARLMEENAEDLARLEAFDNGKAVALARSNDIPGAIDTMRYFAGWPSKLEGTVVPISDATADYHAYTRRQPIGVVGQIIPWNFPIVMAAWKLAPALAAGCTVVLKPAEQTPYTALRLGELILEAGFPAGVVNIVTGYGAEAGQAIVDHPGVAKVAFTGSTAVGREIAARAGGKLKRVTLELGGKSPTIIMPDADMAAAVLGATQACFFNSGQLCFAGTRLFAPRASFDRVLEGVAEAAGAMKIGAGLHEDTVLGPLVSDRQLERVLGKIDAGRSEGASIVLGGGQHGDAGYFVQPTIAVTSDARNTLYRDEVFGPVMTATPYDDPNDVVAMANDTEYGLGAVVYTRDLSSAHLLAHRIEAGTVWVNCELIARPALPFGGFKQSGIGRENGGAVMQHYTETKTICVRIG